MSCRSQCDPPLAFQRPNISIQGTKYVQMVAALVGYSAMATS